MKKFKAMLAATAAVMALSAVSVPMSAFAIDGVSHPGTQTYTFDPGEVVEPGAEPKHDTWNAEYLDQEKQPNPSAKVNVDFSIAPTYTVTIPADVHFSDTTENGRTARGEVKVEDVFLEPDSIVVVTVASRNNYNMLLDGFNSSYNIPYTLKKETKNAEEETVLENLPQTVDPSGDSEKTVGLVADVRTGNQTQKGAQTVNLVYAIDNAYSVPVAGSYSDILTFTIAVRTLT